MIIFVSEHNPHPDKEGLLVDSMHRYCEAARKQKGLLDVYTLKDEKTGKLFGLAIWESEEDYQAARPALAKATEGDDFDSWEKEPVKGYRLRPI